MGELKFDKHIFICVNERAAGEKKSCGEKHGLELVAAFKKLIKDHKLNIKVRAQKAGCLDVCEFGPALVIYPEGTFYSKVTLADVPEIFESHIRNNQPVTRLVLPRNCY